MDDNKLNKQELWNKVLAEIELNVSQATFNTWFRDTYIISIEDGEILVGVPNEFVRTWLAEKYHKSILKSLRNLSDGIRNVEYKVSKMKTNDEQVTTETKASSLPLKDLYVDKDSNLNSRYTFDSFVVGPFNELAYASAQAVIKNPGKAYNPLFVYGKTGHGKTHLIQAVGNHFREKSSSLKTFYLTTEKFAIDYVNSVRANRVNAFKEQYRKYDVLIMDDIQFLSTKEKTQEELFHLFNTLYEHNKQIVFSSDMHPNHLPNLEERLRSRFNAGMIIQIPTPDQESRLAILKSKAEQAGIPVDDEVLELLASQIDSNIRELEGALNTIVVQSQVKGKPLSQSDVKRLIRNNIQVKKAKPVEDVVQAVTDFYGVEEELIHKKTRKKEVVRPRQIIMFILREDYEIAYPTIGQKIGGRDHTTVIHSYEKIKTEMETDAELTREIQQIRSML